MLPQIFRRKDLENSLGLSRSTIYLMISENRFPKPVKIGRRAFGWRSDDISKWLENMQEDRNV